jgi:2-dehydro-3-deoxy-D-arabinonate dehydratase
MKLYKTRGAILLEKNGKYFIVNDDNLFNKMNKIIQTSKERKDTNELLSHLEAPLDSQEIWASGVTYMRSKVGRQEESKKAGGGDFYGHVYEAERPELFFKATRNRVAKPGGKVRIRKDSSWDVPEPELTLMITSSGKIVGYTIGNDMSSRSIEGENPLYLPQAKTYDGCAAVGPCIYVTNDPLPLTTIIDLRIVRAGKNVFQGDVELRQLKRKLEDLVSFLYKECSFTFGSLLMTGTGIVPTSDFTLRSGDEIMITIEPIGTLINTVE